MRYLTEFKNNSNIVFSCTYHVVFCPKYRRSVLVNGVDTRLKDIVIDEARKINVDVRDIEVMPDHVHMLIDVDPRFGIHSAVKRLKGTSSSILRREFPHLKSRIPTLWTNSYFVTTTGGATLEAVKAYIDNQKGV